jgi:DNA-binding Lrp family transcriptional regulator
MPVSENLTEIEKKVLSVLQKGLPRTMTPYQSMARQTGLETGQLIELLTRWKNSGKLRRIGAIVNHFKAGLAGGAMVVWQVEPDRIGQVGEQLASFAEISHVYERRAAGSWPYNLYSMVHGTSTEQVRGAIGRIGGECGVSSCRVLPTERELKKVAPSYIGDEIMRKKSETDKDA